MISRKFFSKRYSNQKLIALWTKLRTHPQNEKIKSQFENSFTC